MFTTLTLHHVFYLAHGRQYLSQMNRWINKEGRKGRKVFKKSEKKRTKMKEVGSEAEEDSV